MGKRSEFPRIKNDNYRTFDQRAGRAIAPLLKHYEVKDFAEPCCGLGDLIWQLKCLGLDCVARYDINPRRPGIPYADARQLTESDLQGASNILSNPPWLRVILHAPHSFQPGSCSKQTGCIRSSLRHSWITAPMSFQSVGSASFQGRIKTAKIIAPGIVSI